MADHAALMDVLGLLACMPVAIAQTSAVAGCTDSAAANYNSAANTADGSCVYGDCSSLRARLERDVGDCFVFNGTQPEDQHWPSELRSRATPSGCGIGQLGSVALASSDKWMVQGSPSAGVHVGPADDQLTTGLPYRFVVDGAHLTVRYVRMSGACGVDGGYMYVNNSAFVSVENVFFAGTGASAPLQGGAIFAVGSTVMVSMSRFDHVQNGISAGSCSLWLNNVDFITADNLQDDAISMLRIYTIAEALGHGLPTQSTLLVDTTFSPWSATAVSDTSGWMPTAGGCIEQKPCNPGYSCSFERYSLLCTPCRPGTRSVDGLTCERCQPGEEPTADRTQCQPCAGSTYSTDGSRCKEYDDGDDCLGSKIENNARCVRCPQGQGPSVNRTQCEACPIGQYSTDGMCRDCSAPTVSHDDRTRCVLCDPGKEPDSASRHYGACQACQGHSFSSFGVQCQPCDNLSTPNHDKTACILPGGMNVVCDPGQGMVDGTCHECAPGKYSPYGRRCDDCTGANKVVLDGTRCDYCPPHFGFLNRTACEPCDPPRYSPGSGAPCENCNSPRIVVKATGSCSLPGDGQVYNADKTGFVQCSPGYEPVRNRSFCRPCDKMMLSKEGKSCSEKCAWDRDPRLVITRVKADSTELTCKFCDDGQQPNDEHTACVAACPKRCAHCSSDGEVCHQCDASAGYYNSSKKLVVCFFDQDYDNLTVSRLHEEYQRDEETDGHCQTAPPCVTMNSDGDMVIRSGFSAVHGTDPILGEVWSVYECSQPDTCAGGLLEQKHDCMNLHAGPLCRECAPNSRRIMGVCETCPNRLVSLVDINIVRATVIVALICAILTTFHLWEFSDHFSIRTLKRGGVYGTMEVFIGFCQIATLFVSVSSEFTGVIEKIPFHEKYLTLLSVVSLNVPAWLSLDCLLGDFYSKWVFQAVGVPLMCFAAVAVKYHYSRTGRQCCKSERVQLHASVIVHVAKQQRSADVQLALFVSYTSVFNSVLHVMLCKQISPTDSVLEADNTISCEADRHQNFQQFALGLTLFLVMVPVRALWYALALPRRTRLTSPCTHKEGLKPWESRLINAFEEANTPYTLSTRRFVPMPELELEPEPEPEPEVDPVLGPDSQGVLQRTSTAPAMGLTRQQSEGAESRAALREQNKLLMDEKRQLANEEVAKQMRERAKKEQKLQDVQKLVERFRHADVLKLMAAEPTTRFRTPRSFWRKPCSAKTDIHDITSLDTADWICIHRVVKRAEQPWAKLVLEELKAKNDGLQNPWNVVTILVQHFSGAELTLLVSNEKAYSVPKRIKEVNEAAVAAGRPRISNKEWEIVHHVVAALREDLTFTEGKEYYRAVDFLRKLLVLCCAFLPSAVARPMFAAFVSLGFAFLHIRVWPYRRSETNVHKMITDFTICFVFYLCSVKAAGEPTGDWMFESIQQLIVVMWQLIVPLSLIVACTAGVRRERRALRDQLRNEMETGELYSLSGEVKHKILSSVSSFNSLARLDEKTWWHRKVLCLRRRSSMRERLLCTCEDEADRVACLHAPVMKCQTSDHDVLHKCRKIPWPWQDEVDKTAHNANLSDTDRDALHLRIRAMDQLNQLKANFASSWADLGLSAEGDAGLRMSLSEPFPEAESVSPGCCGCCKRKPQGEPLLGIYDMGHGS